VTNISTGTHWEEEKGAYHQADEKLTGIQFHPRNELSTVPEHKRQNLFDSINNSLDIYMLR
jgi:anthranilate/para-aminobenzoate synthase component II